MGGQDEDMISTPPFVCCMQLRNEAVWNHPTHHNLRPRLGVCVRKMEEFQHGHQVWVSYRRYHQLYLQYVLLRIFRGKREHSTIMSIGLKRVFAPVILSSYMCGEGIANGVEIYACFGAGDC